MTTLFNIRDHVDEPQTPNASIQHTYNVINLSVFSFGEITFQEAYSISFLQLLEGDGSFPGLLNRWRDAHTQGLLTSGHLKILEREGQAVCQILQAHYPNESMRDFCEKDLLSTQANLGAHLETMSLATACIPFLGQSAEQKQKATGLFANGLLNSSSDAPPGVGDLTCGDMYMKAAADNVAQHTLLRDSREAGILGGSKTNDKCCTGGASCASQINKFCSISSTTGKCSLSSDSC